MLINLQPMLHDNKGFVILFHSISLCLPLCVAVLAKFPKAEVPSVFWNGSTCTLHGLGITAHICYRSHKSAQSNRSADYKQWTFRSADIFWTSGSKRAYRNTWFVATLDYEYDVWKAAVHVNSYIVFLLNFIVRVVSFSFLLVKRRFRDTASLRFAPGR